MLNIVLLPILAAAAYAAPGQTHPLTVVVKEGIWMETAIKHTRIDGPSSFSYNIVEGSDFSFRVTPTKADGSSMRCAIRLKPGRQFTEAEGATVTFQTTVPEAFFNVGAAYDVLCDGWKKP